MIAPQTLTIDAQRRRLNNVVDMGAIDKPQLAENIRTGRAKLSMTRVEFAKAAGISTNTLRSLEHGTHARVADLETLEKVAKVLKVTVDRLIRGRLPIEGGDAMLAGLNREDLGIARAFHDAILDAKHAVRTLLKGSFTEETRERLALLTLRLLGLRGETLTEVEDLVTALEDPKASAELPRPQETAPKLRVPSTTRNR